MNISVVIPNYNGASLLEKNLPKVIKEIEQYERGSKEIIIVDDGSTDESLDVMDKFKKANKNIKILFNEKNLGFSSSVNKGVSFSEGDIVILLNTDITPETGFIKPLINDFKDDKVFAVGCLDKSVENDDVVLRGRGLGEWKRGFLIHRKGEVDNKNTLWVSGGSGAFRKSIWNKLGGLNELYNPFYYEDIDLSYRALKSGYKILFEPKSKVLHEHEKGAIKNEYPGKKIKTIAYRNQFLFVWENATDYILQFEHILWLPYHFAKAILNQDLPFFLGFFNALILLPKVIKSSLRHQKLFIEKDSEVIKNYLK